MVATGPAPITSQSEPEPRPIQRRVDGISWARLAWVAPLTVVVAVAVNYTIRLVAQTLDPSLVRMGQLGPPLISLTLKGVVGAVILFTLLAWLDPRPIVWFRRIA